MITPRRSWVDLASRVSCNVNVGHLTDMLTVCILLPSNNVCDHMARFEIPGMVFGLVYLVI